jgi:peptide subunit release factor 1 (eRF1)
LVIFESNLATDGVEVITSGLHLGPASPSEIAKAVEPLITKAQRSRECDLVSTARERAGGGNHGAYGLPDVLAALNEGRVGHLLVDADARLEGTVDAEGRLANAERELLDDGSSPEPYLGERMVERALETGAQVTPVEGEAAALLGDAQGAAAILRW